MKLDKAFPPTPAAFGDAISKGIREGEKRMKMKYKMRLSMIAACLVVCLLVGAYAAGTGDRTDTTSASTPEGGGAIIGGSNGGTNIFVTVSPSPTPENAAWPDNETNEKTVYMTEFGTWYHDDPICQGMQDAMLVPLSEAIEEHKLPCPICIGKTVYATANGIFYHSDPGCSGMQGAGQWKESDAVANGKLPCPVCLSDQEADLSSYPEKALQALERVFPGCVEVLEKHYNIDQLYAQAYTVDSGTIRVNVSAAAVTVAEVAFFGNETKVEIYFNDVEICRKILACQEENTLSDKLVDLSLICKEELLNNLLTAVHDSVRSRMPVSSEYYNLQIIELNFADEECMTAAFHFETQYYCEALFAFDLAEGDALSNVTLTSQW